MGLVRGDEGGYMTRKTDAREEERGGGRWEGICEVNRVGWEMCEEWKRW